MADRSAWQWRVLLACLLSIGVLVIARFLPHPFAVSAWMSTAAIALHNPRRFRTDRNVIAGAYVFGFLVAAGLSIGSALVAIPAAVACGLALAVLVASPAARRHPPVACLPLAVSATTLLATTADWAVFALLSVINLVCLDLATRLQVGSRPDVRPV